MPKKVPVTLAQIKMALTLDLAKTHKIELAQLTKAKTLKALESTVAYDVAITQKTSNLIHRYETQEDI